MKQSFLLLVGPVLFCFSWGLCKKKAVMLVGSRLRKLPCVQYSPGLEAAACHLAPAEQSVTQGCWSKCLWITCNAYLTFNPDAFFLHRNLAILEMISKKKKIVFNILNWMVKFYAYPSESYHRRKESALFQFFFPNLPDFFFKSMIGSQALTLESLLT